MIDLRCLEKRAWGKPLANVLFEIALEGNTNGNRKYGVPMKETLSFYPKKKKKKTKSWIEDVVRTSGRK